MEFAYSPHVYAAFLKVILNLDYEAQWGARTGIRNGELCIALHNMLAMNK